MKRFLVLLAALFLAGSLFAQKSFLIHLTIDKVRLGKDSVVFKPGKTFLFETTGKTDTMEVAKVKGVPVAIVIEIRRVFVDKQVNYQLGYAFYKKSADKWELIRHFGYTDRNDLLAPRPGFEKSAKKKPAREEFNCLLGDPVQFAAWFRMDVYKK
ncbi:MAG TPA: hypothetical protein VI731_10040 [Bacteroidia bacterium]|nr:hypothetical protein [Bacteroidia bacterium]